MPDTIPIAQLTALCRTFGKRVARRKVDLLGEIERLPRVRARDLLELQATLTFLRAHPDDPEVLGAVRRVLGRVRSWVERLPGGAGSAALWNQGVAGAQNHYSYSYGVVRRLVQRWPDCLEIDWDELADDTRLGEAMELLLTGAENEVAESVTLGWPEWMERFRPASMPSDLAFLLRLVGGFGADDEQRASLYDGCGLPLRYAFRQPGTGRAEVELPIGRMCYQERAIPRERFPLAPRIRAPIATLRPLVRAAGEEIVARCLLALCSRNLEIHPLIWPNPRDVVVFDAGRGIQVVLIGTLPAQRTALTAISFFMAVKNGVPVAYGPASPFLGACEIGINLFPEFRGGEIRTIYAAVMRVLHHAFAAELFFLTSYGMGVDNDDAIKSGAFWFYRKLGFRPSNPAVDALAREEEKRMRARPGYRSDTRMLRRLAQTEAYFDLSGGRRRRFPFERLGMVLSRFLTDEFDGDRALAVRRCEARVRRGLGLGGLRGWSQDEQRALRNMAPVLAMIPGLSGWSTGERARVTRVIRAKGARSEMAAARLLSAHPRLGKALWDLVL